MFGLKRFQLRIQYHEMLDAYLARMFQDIEVVIVKQQFTTSTRDFIILCEFQWKHRPADVTALFARLCTDIDALDAITEIVTDGKRKRTLCYVKGVFHELYTELFQYTIQEFLCFIEYPLVLRQDSGLVSLIGVPADAKRLLEFMRGFGSDPEIVAIKNYTTKDLGVLSVLTDTQRRVLKHAYDRGFFEHPRHIGARELAEGLGIAHTTVLTHLRKSQKRLLAALFDD